jgi:Periplasmic binding protein
MTPFLQFRIWLRRASATQKLSAFGAGAIALALVVWAAVPTGNPGSTPIASGIQGSSSTVGSGPSGSTGSSSARTTMTTLAGAAAAAAASGASAAQGGSGSSATTVPGLGSSPGSFGGSGSAGCARMGTVKIGVVAPTAAGGSLDAVIGNPPAAQEEGDYAAVIDSVNKAGGVDCNKLVGEYAQADLTNPSGVQQACLQFQQDHVFAVLGGFEPEFSDQCLLNAHIPVIDEVPIPQGDATKYYPYYFSTYPTYERLYKNFVGAVNQMGYFGPSHHFAKLGIFYRDCTSEVNRALISYLAAVGISGSKVVTADLGCPATFASPATIEEDALTFKGDGVTTAIIDNDIPDVQNISNESDKAGFHPAWILPDYGESATMQSANFHPTPASEMEGAVAITSGQYGAIASHLPESPATVACDKIMTSHGLPTVYQSGDQFAGSTCSLVWMLVTAMKRGGVNPLALVAGLHAAGSTETSFPNGPDNFSAPGTTAGGEYWREIVYHGTSNGGCQCFTVVNPTWRPSY